MDKSSYARKDRLVKEREHDVYRSRAKLPGSTLCSECGAVFSNGRWVWGSLPQDAKEVTCPACRRIAERFPAGRIELLGVFFNEHHDEILNLVKNVEAKEKANHPMERIMSIEEHSDRTVVSTTGIHIARGIGSSLASAYNGELSLRYLDGEAGIQIGWVR
jgi:DNA-directed RNA polymerase subunit RPC12/RpoP